MPLTITQGVALGCYRFALSGRPASSATGWQFGTPGSPGSLLRPLAIWYPWKSRTPSPTVGSIVKIRPRQTASARFAMQRQYQAGWSPLRFVGDFLAPIGCHFAISRFQFSNGLDVLF